MKEPTAILSEEHQQILKVARALARECEALEKGGGIDREFFKKAIDFIRGYADRFHHAKEEDILFKELTKPGVAMHCNPVEQMLYEHDRGRALVKEADEGLGKDDRKKVVAGMKGYAELIQEHIYKEDNILYPMAEGALSEEAKKEMLKKFKKAEKKIPGARKYVHLASEFERR